MRDEKLEALVLDFCAKGRRSVLMRERLLDPARMMQRDMVGEYLEWDAETTRVEQAMEAIERHRETVRDEAEAYEMDRARG